VDLHSFSKLDPDPHSLKNLDSDPDPHKVNADPKHWLKSLYGHNTATRTVFIKVCFFLTNLKAYTRILYVSSEFYE
jgi:hypothetical protein